MALPKISTRSVLSGFSDRPIQYEVGQMGASRALITNRKVGTAISPTTQQQTPIPSVKRRVGGRTF